MDRSRKLSRRFRRPDRRGVTSKVTPAGNPHAWIVGSYLLLSVISALAGHSLAAMTYIALAGLHWLAKPRE